MIEGDEEEVVMETTELTGEELLTRDYLSTVSPLNLSIFLPYLIANISTLVFKLFLCTHDGKLRQCLVTRLHLAFSSSPSPFLSPAWDDPGCKLVCLTMTVMFLCTGDCCRNLRRTARCRGGHAATGKEGTSASYLQTSTFDSLSHSLSELE